MSTAPHAAIWVVLLNSRLSHGVSGAQFNAPHLPSQTFDLTIIWHRGDCRNAR